VKIFIVMKRRVRWKSHARCEVGGNSDIIKDYLSLSGAKSRGMKQLMAK